MKKITLVNLSIMALIITLMSSCSLRYSDTGKPFDFLKAKRYKAVQKGNDQQEKAEFAEENNTEELQEMPVEKQTLLPEGGTTDTERDGSTVLLVILAILIPPLAVGLYEGITTRFWIDLLLTLLFFIPGMVYALLIVLGAI